MLLEAILGFGALSLVSTCWLVNQIHKREIAEERRLGELEAFGGISKEDRLRVITEKRRVLERDRAEWKAALSSPTSSVEARRSATNAMSHLDKALLQLADEELRTLATGTEPEPEPE